MEIKCAEEVLRRLNKFPLTAVCFRKYVRWVFEQRQIEPGESDLIEAIQEGESERLARLEHLLQQSKTILRLSENDFCKMLGFNTDLLSSDPEKIHDILAEPLLVVDLHNEGFSQLRKLPRFIKERKRRLAVADFLGERKGKTYAIEVKTIRMENKPKPKPGVPTGNASIPSWWCWMFRSNLITKIEDKERRVLKQLNNTAKRFSCDFKVLALYTRRLGPSTLMDMGSYKQEVEAIKGRYPEIDFFLIKDYFGGVVFYPGLPS